MSVAPSPLNTSLEVSLRNDTDLSLVVLQVGALEHGGLTLGPDSKRLLLSDGGLILTPRSEVRTSLAAGPQGIVLADAQSLFPITSGVFDREEGDSGLRLTAGQDHIAAMSLALDLVRNLMAAPSSRLASDLNDSLQASLADPGTDADLILRNFFEAHPPFQKVDATQFGLVLSWARNYAYLWSMSADGSSGLDYDLHAAPYLGGDDDVLGRIRLSGGEDRPVADPGDPSIGLQIEWTPSGGSATKLDYEGGSLGEGTRLSLIGSFVASGWVSGPSSTGLLPVLTGSLDGQRVIAVPCAAIQRPTPAVTTLTAVKAERAQNLDAVDISNLSMSLIGLVSSLVTIVSAVIAVVGYFKARRSANQPIDQGVVAEARTIAQQVCEAQRSQLREELTRLLESLPMIEDIRRVMDQLRELIPETLKEVVRGQLERAMNSLQQQVRDLAAIEVTNGLREVQGDLVEIRVSLNEDLARATQELVQVQRQIPEVIKEMGAQVSRELGEQIKAALEVNQETLEVSEQVQEEMDDIREGEEKVIKERSPVEQ